MAAILDRPRSRLVERSLATLAFGAALAFCCPVGLLLAVPLLSAVKIVCAHVPRLRLGAELPSE